MQMPKISMPHRHTVHYENDQLELEFEVELLENGIVLYGSYPKILRGTGTGFEAEAEHVADWLKSKFSNVEIDYA